MDDKRFEELLSKAFEIEQNNQASHEPSKEELFEAAPFGEKQLEYVKRISKKNKKLPWTKHVARAAAIVLCIVNVGFCTIMLDPGIRGTVGGTVTQWIDGMVGIDFGKSAEYEKIDITKTSVGYIPEGFEVAEDRSEEGFISQTYYSPVTDEYIFIDINESSDISVLTEDMAHEVAKTQIKGYDAYITYSISQRQGSVCYGNQYFTVVVSGMTDKAEIIKIAENIELKD